MQQVLRVPVEISDNQPGANLLFSARKPPSKTRGLFITRAQPFHWGHAAILKTISQDMEEVIIVIAMANQSHTLANIATAGERLAMLLPYLQEAMPQRYYLAAMPYSDFSMENFYELEYLLPAFNAVYTHNPNVEVLAQSAHYPVRSSFVGNGISSSLIRECLRKEEPFADYVPGNVFEFINQSGIAERLKKLHKLENRKVR